MKPKVGVYQIDNKGIFRNIFSSNVISTKDENDLGLLGIGVGDRADTNIESTDSSGIIVKDVETVPASFLVDDGAVLGNSAESFQDGSTIRSFQSLGADDNHGQFSIS